MKRNEKMFIFPVLLRRGFRERTSLEESRGGSTCDPCGRPYHTLKLGK